jgi:hypothetical protein
MNGQELRELQARADSAYQQKGERAPLRLAGEPELPYRKALVGGVQHMSTRWANKSLENVDESVLRVIENDVYEEAQNWHRHPNSHRPGELRAHVRHDAAGRPITSYTGDPNHWNRFCPSSRYAAAGMNSFMTKGAR